MWSDALTGPLWKNHPHRLDPMEAHAQSLQRLSEPTETDTDKEKQVSNVTSCCTVLILYSKGEKHMLNGHKIALCLSNIIEEKQ